MSNINYVVGENIYSSDRIVREIVDFDGYHDGHRKWRRSEEVYGSPKPVKGVYVGQRTYSNDRAIVSQGNSEYEREEEFPILLILESQFRDPIEVFPEDCRRVASGPIRID